MTPTPVTDMTGPQLVARHNQLARELGEAETKRFSSREAGVRRVQALEARWSDPSTVRTTTPAVEEPTIHVETAAKESAAIVAALEPALRQVAKQEAAKLRLDVPLPADRSPTPPVKAKLDPRGVPSSDPAKDKEMPALRVNAVAMDLPPKSPVYARKAGSKQALLVDLLSRPQGATFGELYDALKAHGGKPWQGQTVRSGLAWDMNRVAGYGVRAELLNGKQFAAQGRAYEAARLGMVAPHVGQSVLRWAPGPNYDPRVKLSVYRLTYPAGVSGPLPHIAKATAS